MSCQVGLVGRLFAVCLIALVLLIAGARAKTTASEAPPACAVGVGGQERVWLSSPHDGAVFRPGEHITLIFARELPRPDRAWARAALTVVFDGEVIGPFQFQAGNRTLSLALAAASAGQHHVRAEMQGCVVAELWLSVAAGTLVLHAGEQGPVAVAGGRAALDHWGCLLLGARVSSLPQVSRERPLHIWVNGERMRTDEGWLVVRVPPGPLLLRGAVPDDFGDVALENQTSLTVVLPDRRLFGTASGDAGVLCARALALELHQRILRSGYGLATTPNVSYHETAGRSDRRTGGQATGAKRALISCLHPTRGRPHEALQTRARWLAGAADMDAIEWVFAVDSDDEDTLAVLRHQTTGLDKVLLVSVPLGLGFHRQGTCVAAWNLAALAAHGQVLMAVADDFYPPAAWDKGILEALPAWRPAALMIPDGISSCRAAVPSAQDLPGDAGGASGAVGYGVLQSHPVVNRLRLLQAGYLLYPEYMSVFCDDDFTLWARLDGVEEDGMHLAFEHRHTLHGLHRSASPARAAPQAPPPAGTARGEGGEGGGVQGQVMEERQGMHATTQRNNGYTRYLHGARLFARRANGRRKLQRHLFRLRPVAAAKSHGAQRASPTSAEGGCSEGISRGGHIKCQDSACAGQSCDREAEEGVDEGAGEVQAVPESRMPWLMAQGFTRVASECTLNPGSGAYAHDTDARRAQGVYAGGGVVLSILVVVESCACIPSGSGEARDGAKKALDGAGELGVLAQLVRDWRLSPHASEEEVLEADMDTDAATSENTTRSPVLIEMLVAATPCRACCHVDTGEDTCRCAGKPGMAGNHVPDEYALRNTLLDAAVGRFVAWATPELEGKGARAWLQSVLSRCGLPRAAAYFGHTEPRDKSGATERENAGGIHGQRWVRTENEAEPKGLPRVAHELEMSVLEAVAAAAAAVSRTAAEKQVGAREECSWATLGPVARAAALFVRFRDPLHAEDWLDADGEEAVGKVQDDGADLEALWTYRLNRAGVLANASAAEKGGMPDCVRIDAQRRLCHVLCFCVLADACDLPAPDISALYRGCMRTSECTTCWEYVHVHTRSRVDAFTQT